MRTGELGNMTRPGHAHARVVDDAMVKKKHPENPAKYRMFWRGSEFSSGSKHLIICHTEKALRETQRVRLKVQAIYHL